MTWNVFLNIITADTNVNLNMVPAVSRFWPDGRLTGVKLHFRAFPERESNAPAEHQWEDGTTGRRLVSIWVALLSLRSLSRKQVDRRHHEPSWKWALTQSVAQVSELQVSEQTTSWFQLDNIRKLVWVNPQISSEDISAWIKMLMVSGFSLACNNLH